MDMDLQYFAEEAADSSQTGAPEGTEAEAQPETDQQQSTEKTFTQDEVDKMVQKRMARYDRDHQKEVDNARSEATRLAKMNKDQQKDYKLQQAEKDRQEALSKLARYEMQDVARQQLIDGGYANPTKEDINLIVTDNADTTKANGEAFLKAVERIRQNVRDELLKGNTPKAGGTAVEAPDEATFKKMSYTERLNLKHENPDLYSQLLNKSY